MTMTVPYRPTPQQRLKYLARKMTIAHHQDGKMRTHEGRRAFWTPCWSCTILCELEALTVIFRRRSKRQRNIQGVWPYAALVCGVCVHHMGEQDDT